jgi:prepilin-type N-terminal cleavage/methylation domain-containing protein
MRRIRSEDGFTLIEVLVAALVLVIGIGAMVATFNAARRLTLVGERQSSMAHRAQAELERIKSLPYSEIALTGTSPSWSSNAGDYTYVSAPSGTCPSAPSGAAPTYQPDHSQLGTTAYPLVINGCTYTLNGTQTTLTGGQLAPVTPWTDGRFSGNVYDFVTWYSDPTCSQTSTPGSACPTTNDYKQVTIVVTLTGATQPSHPAILSAFLPNPDQNSSQNLLTSGSTYCGSTGQQPCTNTLTGTPVQYFLCDSSYSGSSCSPPPCTGNNLHDTLVALGLIAPAPDLLGSTLPTGSCTNSTGTPTPPCYGLDILTGCQGLPIVPTGNSTCGSPPANNSEAHSWVTPGIPSGITVNLTGNGSLTTYIESASGVSVNATVCLGIYLVPGGLIGALTGNLLSQPIGVAVSASATAQVGVPTPVSFDFNLGTADAIAGGGILGLPRIEAVVWIAASASTDVQLAYDQAGFASQLTLVTS